MGGDEAAFARLVEQFAGAPIKPLAYNVFLPGDRTIVGPRSIAEWLASYSREALARIARADGPGAIVVLGSGRSRSIRRASVARRRSTNSPTSSANSARSPRAARSRSRWSICAAPRATSSLLARERRLHSASAGCAMSTCSLISIT
jgi:hypothetical protein